MIQVTKPFLPPLQEYQQYVEQIWKRQWLTNMGPLSSELEMRLKDYLKLDHLLFVSNGTTALQIALKVLDVKGEVITTPFSFVATTSAVVWEGCTPVFVDIDKNSLNIDPTKIEAAITPNTTAILATHVYGNPCDIDRIDHISKKYGLKVIYDAAHAFGVQYKGKSIFEFGDVSICSLHATKLYHSVEGGLIVTTDPELLKKSALMRNFGISGFGTYGDLGINGKNSELHAAMGLVNLLHIESILDKRKELAAAYHKNLKGLHAVYPVWNANSAPNYSYFPLILESEEFLLKVVSELDKHQIFTRRYFYPSLANSLPYLPAKQFTYTDDISKRILCLPLYHELTKEEIHLIARIILRVQNN